MKMTLLLLVIGLPAAALFRCQNDGGNGNSTQLGGDSDLDSETGTGSSAPICVTDGRIEITDDTNYSFSSHLDIGLATVRSGYDLLFDWSGLTADLRGRPLNPETDVELVFISYWPNPPNELETMINEDRLPTEISRGAFVADRSYRTSDGPFTSARLLELNSPDGSELPEEAVWRYFDPSLPDYPHDDPLTFMVTVHAGDPDEVHFPFFGNTDMLGFFSLAPDSPNTTVVLSSATTSLDHSVSLVDIPPIAVPVGTPTLVVDWRRMTTNALGRPFAEHMISEAVVAHFNHLTLADIETEFLSLKEQADGWWSADATALNTMNLGELVDAAGAPFSGIDAVGIWLVALFCTEHCINPAPWSITLLTPCE